MTNPQKPFPILYWGADQSTEVQFQPADMPPDNELVSACFVFAELNGEVAMSRPKRGWGLPGGHREPGETAEVCLRREAMEEAGIELDNLRLIGWWATAKRFESEHNRQYPDRAYQLLYVASVAKVHDFVPQHEVSERAFVPVHQVGDWHHDAERFQEIFEFIKTKLW